MNQTEVFKTERKSIDGHSVESTVLPALFAIRLKTRLLQKIAPSLGRFVSAINLDALKGKKTTIADLLSVLNMTEVGSAVEAIAQHVEPPELQQIILDSFQSTVVDGRNVANEENFNLAFSGKLLFMYQVLFFSWEVNYGDFFAVLRTGMTAAQRIATVPETKKSTTPPGHALKK